MFLSPPPRENASVIQWQQWYELLWRYVKFNISYETGTVAISSNATYHGVTGTSGATLTLPTSSDLEDGWTLVVQDEGGAAAAHNITIARTGTDTINGTTSVAITANYGRKTIIKRGVGKFFSA
jgi:hypothetical protein